MQAHAGDAGVFIRSMATRGHLGGLARATGDAALVLDAAGRDVVLIETVGVGQDEMDIVRTADVSIVTLVPGAGDDVQALKAGIMEIADIFVVNKADREGADRTAASIEAMLSLQTYGPGEWRPPILQDRSDDRAGSRRAARDDRALSRAYRGRARRPPPRAGGVPGAGAARAAVPSRRRRAGARRGRVRRVDDPHRRPGARPLHGGRTDFFEALNKRAEDSGFRVLEGFRGFRGYTVRFYGFNVLPVIGLGFTFYVFKSGSVG